MSAKPQLSLVTDPAPGYLPHTADPVRRIFEHWVAMFNRNVRRCKLGPTRRAAINAALAMGYDEETLLACIDGIASDPLDNCRHDGIREAMRELEWLLASEARIERWAERGDQLHQRMAQADQPSDTPTHTQTAPDPAARQRLAELARRLRAGLPA